MTRKNQPRRVRSCSDCARYYANRCHTPIGKECDYLPLHKQDDPDRLIGTIVAFIVAIAAVITLLFFGCQQKPTPTIVSPAAPVSAVQLLKHSGHDTD